MKPSLPRDLETPFPKDLSILPYARLPLPGGLPSNFAISLVDIYLSPSRGFVHDTYRPYVLHPPPGGFALRVQAMRLKKTFLHLLLTFTQSAHVPPGHYVLYPPPGEFALQSAPVLD